MSEHIKVEMTVVNYLCSERDCEHWELSDGSACPTWTETVCKECTARNWEYHEGPVVPWEHCWLNPYEDDDPCECGCHDDLGTPDQSDGGRDE